MATRMAIITMTIRSSMMVKAGFSLLWSLFVLELGFILLRIEDFNIRGFSLCLIIWIVLMVLL